MFGLGLAIGVLAAGTLMYYIQPWVKDTVAKAFSGYPAMIAKAQDLQARAEALLVAAQNKRDGA